MKRNLSSLSQDAYNYLQLLINNEENLIRSNIPVIFRRQVLIDIARSIDLHMMSISMEEIQKSPYYNEMLLFFDVGINRFINLFFDDWSKCEGIPLYASSKESQKLSDAIIFQCGRIGGCDLLSKWILYNLVDCIELEHDYLYLKYHNTTNGVESIERNEFSWVQGFLSNIQQPFRDVLDREKDEILVLMSKHVSVWNKHFIQYNAHPTIDEHFIKSGSIIAPLLPGYDSFPSNTEFGGIEYRYYISAIASIIGLSQKHLVFSMILHKNKPELELENLLTIYRTKQSIISYISYFVGIDNEIAKTIFDTLTLSYVGSGLSKLDFGDSPPPFILLDKLQVLHLLSGSLNNPFLFLLNSLRKNYGIDWDSAVNRRENAFRRDLYSLFGDDKIKKINKRVILRYGDKELTDIDAVLYNKQTGSIGLFQLKWQDFFGYSMKKRESQKKILYIHAIFG